MGERQLEEVRQLLQTARFQLLECSHTLRTQRSATIQFSAEALDKIIDIVLKFVKKAKKNRNMTSVSTKRDERASGHLPSACSVLRNSGVSSTCALSERRAASDTSSAATAAWKFVLSVASCFSAFSMACARSWMAASFC